MDDFSRSVLVGKNYLHANSIQDSIAALNLSIDLLASGRTGGGQSTGKRGKEKKGKGRRRSRSAGSRRGHETVPLPPPLVDAASSSAHAHTAADAARQANPRFPDVVDEQLAAASVLQLRGAAFLAAGAIDAALADATAALDLLESHEATEPPIPIVRPSPLGSRLAPSIERRLSVSPARSVSLSNAIAPLSSSARSNGNTSDSDSRGRDSAPYVSLRALSPSSLFDDDCPPATMLVDEETEDQLQVPPPDVRPPPDEMVARILRCRVHLVQAGAELCAGRPRAAATFALQACMADGQWGVLALEGLALRGAALLRAGEPAKAATSFATAAGLCEGSVYSRCRFDPMWPTSEDFAQRRTSLLAYAMNAYRLAGEVDEQRSASDRVLFSHRMVHPYLLAAETAGSMAVLEENIANAMRLEQDHQEAWVGCQSLSERWPSCNFGELLRAHVRIDQLEVTPTPRFQVRRASLLLAEGMFADAKEVLDGALPVLRRLARVPREPASVAVRTDDDDRIAASARPNPLGVIGSRAHLALRSTSISLFLAQTFDTTGDMGVPIPCQGPDDELREPDVVTAAAFASLTSQLRDAHSFMGAACLALGLFEEAAAQYSEALRLGAGGELKVYLAVSLYGAGCYELAEAELTNIISNPPPSIIFTTVETQSRAYAWRSRVRKRRGSRSLKAYIAVFIDLYSAITHNSRLVFTVQYLCCLLQCLCIFLTIFATSLAPHVNGTTVPSS